MKKQAIINCSKLGVIALALSNFAGGSTFSVAEQLRAQSTTISSAAVKAASVVVPADVVAEIKATPAQGVFPVTGTEKFKGKILKCDVLQLDSQATLILEDVTSPYVAIVARRLILRAPDETCRIRFDPAVIGGNGSRGQNGPEGTPGHGDGGAGRAGSAGVNSQAGATKALPKVYLIVEEIRDQQNSPIMYLNLSLGLQGIPGGDGGDGGNGGNGGPGARGRNGAEGLIDCRTRPGDGGRGGAGGPGGIGGSGGVGGNGADLTYVGPQVTMDRLFEIRVSNFGGSGGFGGRPGVGGSGGAGGSRGRQTARCTGGSTGGTGANGPEGQPGPEGTSGGKGAVDYSLITDLNAYF